MKFEYKIYHIDTGYSDLKLLNELGKEGWEVISATLIRERTIFVLLKRSIPEEAKDSKKKVLKRTRSEVNALDNLLLELEGWCALLDLDNQREGDITLCKAYSRWSDSIGPGLNG